MVASELGSLWIGAYKGLIKRQYCDGTTTRGRVNDNHSHTWRQQRRHVLHGARSTNETRNAWYAHNITTTTGEDGTTPPTSNTTNTALPVGMGAELRLHQTNTQYPATKEAQPNKRHCRRSDRHANSSERWCTIQHVTTHYDEERVRVVAAH